MHVVNLTPHPIHVYAPDTPDTVTGEHRPILTIPTSGAVARIEATRSAATDTITVDGVDVPVVVSAYGNVLGLPLQQPDVWCLVALPVATELRLSSRDDLLVVDRAVRNTEGTVVGCRGFGQVALWGGRSDAPETAVCPSCAVSDGQDVGERDPATGAYRCVRGHVFTLA